MKRTPDLSDELLRTAAKSAGNNELNEYKETICDELTPEVKEEIFENLKKEQEDFESKKKTSPFTKILQRVAVIILVIISVSFACILSVEAARDALWDAIIKFKENYTFFKYPDNPETEAPDQIERFKYPEVDKRFEENVLYRDFDILIVEYRSEDAVVVYDQWPLEAFNTYLMEEAKEANPKEISVGRHKGYLTEIETDTVTFYSIIWTDHVYAYSISGTVPLDELLKMAESVK